MTRHVALRIAVGGAVMMASERTWSTGTDVAALHELIVQSDAHHARTYGRPVPVRAVETMRRLVEAGQVQVLSHGAEPVAMFALTDRPPFAQDIGVFPDRSRPLYRQRLAIRPARLGDLPLVGMRCLRRAATLAVVAGADALRAEANPDLTATARLLQVFGFVRYGPVQSAGGLRRIYLEKHLDPTTGRVER
jgi:hypothetical protein